MRRFLGVIIISCLFMGTAFFVGNDGKISSEYEAVLPAQPTKEEVFNIMHPKREFRAAWITTFTNLDWPSKRGLSNEVITQEYQNFLNTFQNNAINSVVVQVRAAGDAFYKSELAPWSEWITGKQGVAPADNFDPLQMMISQAHDRNMEFHAWMNPFRAVSHVRFSSVAENNVVKKHPEWFFQYGNTIYFNPGIPEVRQHIVDVVVELVRNYDVDGIHFDDYFYPYTIEGEKIPDDSAFAKYGNEFSSIKDWRRNNINLLVQEVNQAIKAEKQHVKFGISPLAIWRNKLQDQNGSATNSGQTSYDNLYCDTKLWLDKNWVDYLAPQLYWSTTNRYANYNNLINWWSENNRDRHLYIGHAIYKLDVNDRHTFGTEELMKQVRINRTKKNVNGSIYFRAQPFLKNHQNFHQAIQEDIYKYPALVPKMAWIDSIPPNSPEKFKAKSKRDGVFLRWKAPSFENPMDSAAYYVVYRFQGHLEGNQNIAANIIKITKETSFVDSTAQLNEQYSYVVTAVDRLHNESVDCASETIHHH